MDILSENPYARFFKDLRDVPNINNFNIALSCYPTLDQRVYNLPYTSQVAAIWTESDDESLDKQAHILVYTQIQVIGFSTTTVVMTLYNILYYFLGVNLDGTMELNESIREREVMLYVRMKLILIHLLLNTPLI